MNKIFFILISLLFVCSCEQHKKYQVFHVSSPDRQKCLTFMGEYDSYSRLLHSRMYVLGSNPEATDALPTSDYAIIGFQSHDFSSVKINWAKDTIKIRDIAIIENKMANPLVHLRKDFSKAEKLELEAGLWTNYDLQGIHRNEYLDCQH